MIRVKVTVPGLPNNFSIKQFTSSADNKIFDVQFFFNQTIDDSFDYWFVIDNLLKDEQTTRIRKNGLFFFTAEHIWPEDYYLKNSNINKFLHNFDKVFSNYSTNHPASNYEIPFLPWMINHNHGTYDSGHLRDFNFFSKINEIPKDKFISVICSDKAYNSWQTIRLQFAKNIKNYYGTKLDWFGNGISSIEEKWTAIAPYKYHIVLENNISNNLISEKLYDSFLGLSVPLYSGAPNARSYFPLKSFIPIDIKNLNEVIAQINRLENDDTYRENLDALRHARNLVLNEYNLWFRLARIAMKYSDNLGDTYEQTLRRIKNSTILDRSFDRLKKYFTDS